MNINFDNITLFFETHHWEALLGFCTLMLAYVTAMALMKAKNNFPPGPLGLPLVGYVPFLTRNMHLDFMQLGEKYGDVFSLKLGSQDIVVLHGADAIREAFNKPEFLGRPPISIMQKVVPSSAFWNSNLQLWKEQSKFVAQCIKDLGLSKSKFQENLKDEVTLFMDVLRNSWTQPIYVCKPLCYSIYNTVCYLIFGKRFEYDDPKHQFLEKNSKEFSKLYSQICMDVMFPWMRYIPFATKFLRSNKARSAIQKYEDFFLKELKGHLKSYNSAHSTDFFDRYLKEIDRRREKHPDTSFTKNMLMSNTIDLFFAATESIASTFLWFIYIIAAFLDVQKKVQKEIMEVIGQDRTPEYMDMRRMPYVRAVMMEMMRWKGAGPVSLMHYTLDDTTVGGYNIQKGTTVIANLWAVHHDHKYWKDPEIFNPDRFLSKDRKSVIKPSNFMPFLVGRRACPGESMAYLELFLYFTSILREFDIVFPDGMEPTFKGRLIITYQPEPYLVRFIPKN